MSNRIVVLALVLAIAAGAGGYVAYHLLVKRDNPFEPGYETYEVKWTEYNAPKPVQDVLVDDRLEEKRAIPFNAALVDRRPEENGWLLNASSAVIRLDVPLVKPDVEPNLLTLHASYADAVGPAPAERGILPSVNLLDGKAKQFDDGLYAALDQAYYTGLARRLTSHVEFIRKLYQKVGPTSVAAPYLAAGLELAHVHVTPTDGAAQQRLLDDFGKDEVRSKPIGFYTWNKALADCFRFLRFFQRQFDFTELAVPQACAAALAGIPDCAPTMRRPSAFMQSSPTPTSA